MTAFTGEVHRLAARWPMLPDDELQEMADSIASNGLRHPLVLDPEGRLVDGRNRLAACDLVGVVPSFTTDATLTDENAVRTFINEENGVRRNVSTGQKAMAHADDLAAMGKRKGGRWARGSISLKPDLSGDANAWRLAMVQAGLVIDHRPDLVDAVIAGEIERDDKRVRYGARLNGATPRRARALWLGWRWQLDRKCSS